MYKNSVQEPFLSRLHGFSWCLVQVLKKVYPDVQSAHKHCMQQIHRDAPTFSMLVSQVTCSPGLYSGAKNSSYWFPHFVSEIASVTRPLRVISRLPGVILGTILRSNMQPATQGEPQNYSYQKCARYRSVKTDRTNCFLDFVHRPEI
jgi:hypothetical protein